MTSTVEYQLKLELPLYISVQKSDQFRFWETAYPSPKLTLTLHSHSGQNDGFGEEGGGGGGTFPRNLK